MLPAIYHTAIWGHSDFFRRPMEEKAWGHGKRQLAQTNKDGFGISVKELGSGANRNAHATNKPPDSLPHRGYRPSCPSSAQSTASSLDRTWPDTR